MQYEVDSYKLEYIEEKEQYFIYFKDSVGEDCKLEIQKEVFDTYMQSRKEYRKIRNQYVRHEEQSEQSEISLYEKAINKEKSVEDKVIENIDREKLRKAKKELSEVQRRRIELHIENDVTIRDLAKKENVRKNQIEKSITLGIKKLKNFFEN